MADWVWVESPGTSIETTARLRTAQFGDGYQQRAPDGINDLVRSMPLQFDDVDDAVAVDMVGFLEANRGLSFNYVPLWATAPIKVVCSQWRRTLGSRIGISAITATFEQVFEP